MARLNFVCPQCRGTQLEVHFTVNEVSMAIEDIEPYAKDEAPVFCYGEMRIHDDDFTQTYYQCENCGYILQDGEGHEVGSEEELSEWLEQKGMIKPEKEV